MMIDVSELAKQAGERYQQTPRQKAETEATGSGDIPMSGAGSFPAAAPAPDPDLQQRKMNRMARVAPKDRAGRLAAEAGLTTSGDQAELLAALGNERILGSRDIVDISFITLAVAMSRGVGRIRLANGFGTGFLVGPGLVMTNNHVLPTVGEASGALLQMDYQENSRGELLPVQTYALNPKVFFVTNQELDFTVVSAAPISKQGKPISRYPWIKLIADLGKIAVGDPVNIIQHPRGELKQVAFRNNTLLEIPSGRKAFLYYSTDTEPGSSGSPCFNDLWELIALHHSGVPRMDGGRILKTGGQPWVKNVDRPELIDWVANEGARVSAMVEALRDLAKEPERKELVEKILDLEAPNPIEMAREDAGEEPPRRRVTVDQRNERTRSITMENSFTWTVPLQVTVSLGDVQMQAGSPVRQTVEPGVLAPVPALPATPSAIGEAGTDEAAVVIDGDWKARRGYDPDFLGVHIPLPKLSAAMLADTVEVPEEFRGNGQKFILNYQTYSVAMNKRRRMPWFSACSLDGDRPKVTRPKDKWFFDPRIDRKFQAGEELYTDANIDRGHVTRREDAAWGPTLDAAVKASNDTFHFTNCTPQLSAFNQGKDRWQGLENFLLDKAKKEKRRMVILSGPIFAKNDPLYRNAKMSFSVRVPLQFWKVCALVREDGSLAATGFQLGQEDIGGLDGFEEKFDVPLAQVAIADLEAKTGLDFGALRLHDHFADGGDPGTLEVEREDGTMRIKMLRDFSDIVI